VFTGAGFSASFGIALSFADPEELCPGPGGVSVLGDPAVGVPEPEGPPSFASLRRRICSIVSWSGASGVAAGGGCSFGSIFSFANSVFGGFEAGKKIEEKPKPTKIQETDKERLKTRKRGCLVFRPYD
jgi:hypothetical protein